MRTLNLPRLQQGVSLVEVLIAMIILAMGLLGLVGLQGRLQVLQMESYQRAQALILLNDLANRIVINRNNAASYVTVNPVGTGNNCPVAAVGETRAQSDMRQWCNAIQGAAETVGAGATRVGAMVGGRGCVQSLGSNEYMVTVAWQGLGPVSAPPDSVTCGAGAYDGGADSVCTDDLCRRAVTTIVRIATL
jgi:type IV pilus assembly protein PilV